MAVADPRQLGLPSGYTVPLSSSLSESSAFPLEVTFANIEPHGAVLLYRFTSGEYAEQFELSEAEVDALFVTWRRWRRLLKRASASAFLDLGALLF